MINENNIPIINPVKKRIYIRSHLKNLSPLIIGSGEDEQTDIDVIRDGNGTPFIPGTSIAGVLRHYAEEHLGKKEEEQKIINALFGEKEKDSIQSLLHISDLTLAGNSCAQVNIRDGIKLDPLTKTTAQHTTGQKQSGGAKYEYEIIETGACFDMKMELIIRENHKNEEKKIYDLLYITLESLEKERIRLGAKTRRGFGRLKLENTKVLPLDMETGEDVNAWIDFNWNFNTNNGISYFKKDILTLKSKTVTRILAKFKIPYSLIIRHYNENPSDDDTTHLVSNSQMVIPGTSWNGVLRHAIYHLLLDVLVHNNNQNELEPGKKFDRFKKIYNDITGDLFGYVNPDDLETQASASRISIDESTISNGNLISYTRNKVDRFTGGVVDSALFSEKPVYGGETALNIEVENPGGWEIGLLLLALKDIGNGIQPLGGDANIGRGILEREKKEIIKIDENPLNDQQEQEYLKKFGIYLDQKIKQFDGVNNEQ